MKRSIATLTAALVAGGAALAGCDLGAARSPGEKLWRRQCAECHGLDASGNTPRFMGDFAADLLDDSWTSGGDRYSQENVIREGVFGKMPAFPDLTREEMRALLDHLATLRGETPE